MKTIHASPELKEAAAMFAPILQSTAKKRIPLIDETKEKIEKFLIGSTTSEFLEKDIEILEKSLECRKSDIEKAENTSDEYFLKLLKDLEEAKKDVIPINYALKKIKEYSE